MIIFVRLPCESSLSVSPFLPTSSCILESISRFLQALPEYCPFLHYLYQISTKCSVTSRLLCSAAAPAGAQPLVAVLELSVKIKAENTLSISPMTNTKHLHSLICCKICCTTSKVEVAFPLKVTILSGQLS